MPFTAAVPSAAEDAPALPEQAQPAQQAANSHQLSTGAARHRRDRRKRLEYHQRQQDKARIQSLELKSWQHAPPTVQLPPPPWGLSQFYAPPGQMWPVPPDESPYNHGPRRYAEDPRLYAQQPHL
mmetsp:Transcript_59333/g.117867  ORF Transcript_59333/g.117867 Transcript_59333/m.117867 type:complete len:125 (-) Transcript_59333:669-1043(-)